MAIDAPQAVGRLITPDFDVELFQATPAASSLAKAGFWGDDGFSFGDLLDLINPLQHIPIISNIYRAVTGDQIAAGPRLLGGGLFGGPIGLAVSMANVAVEDATGKDLGGHILAVAGFGESREDKPRAPVSVADARPFAPGAASGNEIDLLPPVRPNAGSFFQVPGMDTLAAARGNLFSLSLSIPGGAAAPAGAIPALPAASRDDDSRQLFDRRLRAEELSAQDLAKILATYQRAELGNAASASPSTDSRLEK